MDEIAPIAGARSGVAPLEARVTVAERVELRVLHWPAAPRVAGGPAPAPFLLVHGLASNARLWDGVASRLAADGHETAAVDLRGHGRSDKPDSGYDFITIDEDLVALMAGLGFSRPVLVGQSWGANLVLDLASHRPELLSGVVLVDGGLGDMQDRLPTWQECWARLAPPRLVGLAFADVERHVRAAHPDWAEEGIAGTLANFEVRSDGTIAPWLTRERHELILRALWAHRPSTLWQLVGIPVLIVPADSGDAEWTAGKRTNAAAAEAVLAARRVPVRVRWFEGDHDIQAQHPAELAALLEAADRDGFFGGAIAAGAPEAV